MSEHEIELVVDGTPRRARVEARRLLVHALRDDLDVTAVNVGCDTSQCGACTVRIDGEIVKSCTVLAVQADGARLTTAAGLAPPGELDAVQRAFHEAHGLQCGFCTPGMVLAAHAILEASPEPDEAEIRDSLHGNLCRCTGYQNIVEAIRLAAEARRDAAPASVAPEARREA